MYRQYKHNKLSHLYLLMENLGFFHFLSPTSIDIIIFHEACFADLGTTRVQCRVAYTGLSLFMLNNLTVFTMLFIE